ncbi:hypothetical protein OKA04_12765 [Luteolibacter flavescens]|uniref:DUF1376 domain-containing protein n=1 Tax=Luteolibacter flavescens TaxID=1859460 RepID=A0ABT3FPW3_9BACT|nr:hypothetical protein [Luteolibacter flavescens]MCW1885603.1 hypothetical protein [Luteolibacter flavescens]
MADLPYLQFFPADWLQDTRVLSLSAKGAWIDLLCAMWTARERGRIRMRLPAYGRLIGATDERTAQILDEITDLGIAEREDGEDGTITVWCRRMLRDAGELEAQAEQRKQSAANAARVRWGKKPQSGPDASRMRPASAAQCEPDANPEARSQMVSKLDYNTRENDATAPPSPAASPPHPAVIPTLDEAKRYALSAPVPISEDCAIAFHDTQQAEGWITRNGHPIADWRAALRRYASRWNEFEKSKSSQPPASGGNPRPRPPATPASGYGESTDLSGL